MISKITGTLVRLGEAEAYLQVQAFEYQVFVPDFVRRQLQSRLQQEVTLRTLEYLEGNPQHGRLVPRLIGFLSEGEKQFFEMFCSVDGVGVKKALRAMTRPVQEVAVAIEEQDVAQLSGLPGVGPAVAERIVAKLRRKMARFALLVGPDVPEPTARSDVFVEACEALQALGHSPSDAREKVEQVQKTGKKLKSVEEVLFEVYQRQQP